MSDTRSIAVSTTALIVVDVQNDFCHARGSMARGGADLSLIGPAIRRLRTLLAEARQCGLPVVFLRTEHDDEVDSRQWRCRLDGVETSTGQPPQLNCRTDSWGAEFFDVEPLPGELVVVKHRYSGFSAPQFETSLRSMGVTSLLLTGVATQVCVESTLRDAVDRDFVVSAVEDCCASYAPEHHESALERFEASFGPTVDSDSVMSRLRTARTDSKGETR